MTPEQPHVLKGDFTVGNEHKRKIVMSLVGISGLICLNRACTTSQSGALFTDTYRSGGDFFFVFCLVIFLSGIVYLLLRVDEGHLKLTSNKIDYKLGIRKPFEVGIEEIESFTKSKENVLELQSKDGWSYTMPLNYENALQVEAYLSLYLRFRHLVPAPVWKRFTFQDIYAPKEFHTQSVRMFLFGYIRSYADCGWLVTIKHTTYYFPHPWPASYGAQDTGFSPLSGVPEKAVVLPQPVSDKLHLLLKTILVSPLPSYQKEFILAGISRELGGGPLFGPLYKFFRIGESRENGLTYFSVPLMWAKHVSVREVELQ